MSLRRRSARLGKSPLSRINDDNAGTGGMAANPVVVEEGPVETSKCACKRQKLDKKSEYVFVNIVIILVVVCSSILSC